MSAHGLARRPGFGWVISFRSWITDMAALYLSLWIQAAQERISHISHQALNEYYPRDHYPSRSSVLASESGCRVLGGPTGQHQGRRPLINFKRIVMTKSRNACNFNVYVLN
ncbi:hypothetical protein F4803DRAFT_197139 [Xylaria telfairii]|nr:hypothetical protein F4803DRAFT_197139 [Xylaria telfairii]